MLAKAAHDAAEALDGIGDLPRHTVDHQMVDRADLAAFEIVNTGSFIPSPFSLEIN